MNSSFGHILNAKTTYLMDNELVNHISNLYTNIKINSYFYD